VYLKIDESISYLSYNRALELLQILSNKKYSTILFLLHCSTSCNTYYLAYTFSNTYYKLTIFFEIILTTELSSTILIIAIARKYIAAHFRLYSKK